MEHPLIAKPHEIQAILNGTQKQLRRIVKPGPGYQASWLSQEGLDSSPSVEIGTTNGLPIRFGARFEHPKGGPLTFVYCPFGRVGDRLWVREKFFPMRYDWKELGSSAPILYSDGFIRGREAWGETYQGLVPPVGHAWKGAVTMPREASRILLEITAIRVERLDAISEADAKAEGVAHLFSAEELRGPSIASSYFASPEESGYRNYLWHGLKGRHGHNITYSQIDAWAYQYSSYDTAAESYSSLWEATNGPGSWEANPWIWVVEFKTAAL